MASLTQFSMCQGTSKIISFSSFQWEYNGNLAQLFTIAFQLGILLTYDNEQQVSISILYLVVCIKREKVRALFACEILRENVVVKYKNYGLHSVL